MSRPFQAGGKPLKRSQLREARKRGEKFSGRTQKSIGKTGKDRPDRERKGS